MQGFGGSVGRLEGFSMENLSIIALISGDRSVVGDRSVARTRLAMLGKLY